MARINDKRQFRGAIGNVVFKTLDGKEIVQSRPSRLKQTAGTKISSSEFQQCSTWSRLLREGLDPFLLGRTDSYMYRRFTGAFYNALQTNEELPKGARTPLNADMTDLAGFEFNAHSPFEYYFTPPISAELDEQRQVTISLPAFNPQADMHFAEHTHKAELLLYVYATNLQTNAALTEDYTVINLDQNTALLSGINWTSCPMPEGCFILVCAKLMYYNVNKFSAKDYVNSSQLSPAVIVGAFRNGQ